MTPSNLTTDAFAARLGIKPQSVRVRLCRTGSYFGVRPLKAPSGRLLWPAASPEQLLSGPARQESAA